MISQIPIYLISDPVSKNREITVWFFWTPEESFIVVEIPFGLKTPDNFFPLGIITHEFFHLILKKNKTLSFQVSEVAKKNAKLFTKVSKNYVSGRMFLEELLISSFVPDGHLSEKYLSIKVNIYTQKPKDLLDWRRLIAFKLQDEAKRYIKSKRRIDKKYIKYILGIIKQNKK